MSEETKPWESLRHEVFAILLNETKDLWKTIADKEFLHQLSADIAESQYYLRAASEAGEPTIAHEKELQALYVGMEARAHNIKAQLIKGGEQIFVKVGKVLISTLIKLALAAL